MGINSVIFFIHGVSIQKKYGVEVEENSLQRLLGADKGACGDDHIVRQLFGLLLARETVARGRDRGVPGVQVGLTGNDQYES